MGAIEGPAGLTGEQPEKKPPPFYRGRPDSTTGVLSFWPRCLPGDGPIHFRLGVAHRARYDSGGRQPDDFREAVEHWEAALDADPNNYIWRRRIQQYGPRLEKPYPFYDWVPTARAALEARGEVPPPLVVEPGGAEFAEPTRTFVTSDGALPEPDPDDRICHDSAEFVLVETLTVRRS